MFLYVGPLFGFLLMGGAIWACVSAAGFHLRTCRGIHRLKASSYWERLQAEPAAHGASAKAGPVVRKLVSGRIMTALGVLLSLGALFFMLKAALEARRYLFCVALLPLPAAFLLLACGIQRLIGTRRVVCPYCSRSVVRTQTVPYYICCYCKKASIRQGDWFTAEEAVRADPRFMDLPEL